MFFFYFSNTGSPANLSYGFSGNYLPYPTSQQSMPMPGLYPDLRTPFAPPHLPNIATGNNYGIPALPGASFSGFGNVPLPPLPNTSTNTRSPIIAGDVGQTGRETSAIEIPCQSLHVPPEENYFTVSVLSQQSLINNTPE